MDLDSERLAAATADYRERKAAAEAFRAAVNGKINGLQASGRSAGSLALPPGVLRACRRELELSCEYLARLEAEAERAGMMVQTLRRGYGSQDRPGTRSDIESGVA
jgi:hypothetical protein